MDEDALQVLFANRVEDALRAALLDDPQRRLGGVLDASRLEAAPAVISASVLPASEGSHARGDLTTFFGSPPPRSSRMMRGGLALIFARASPDPSAAPASPRARPRGPTRAAARTPMTCSTPCTDTGRSWHRRRAPRLVDQPQRLDRPAPVLALPTTL
jgi:hypothetical protein